MSYIVIPAKKDNSVFLTCEGVMTLAEMTAAWREVHAVLVEQKWERVLMDVTALRSCSETGAFFDLAKLLWHDFPREGRIAVVIRWDQSCQAKLLEVLVRSVGMYLTVFVSEEQAENWLSNGAGRAAS